MSPCPLLCNYYVYQLVITLFRGHYIFLSDIDSMSFGYRVQTNRLKKYCFLQTFFIPLKKIELITKYYMIMVDLKKMLRVSFLVCVGFAVVLLLTGLSSMSIHVWDGGTDKQSIAFRLGSVCLVDTAVFGILSVVFAFFLNMLD